MQDTESDTFVIQSWPERYAKGLQDIGVDATPQEIATSKVEHDDYYGRYFTQTPRMVTNKGTINLKDSNIDIVQIIQKG